MFSDTSWCRVHRVTCCSCYHCPCVCSTGKQEQQYLRLRINVQQYLYMTTKNANVRISYVLVHTGYNSCSTNIYTASGSRSSTTRTVYPNPPLGCCAGSLRSTDLTQETCARACTFDGFHLTTLSALNDLGHPWSVRSVQHYWVSEMEKK